MSNFDTDTIYVYAGISDKINDCKRVDDIFIEDVDRKFFMDKVGYSTCAINQELKNAVNFFYKTFNLDFRDKIIENGTSWTIPGAKLLAYVISDELNVELISIGENRSSAEIFDGGWMVLIDEPGFVGVIDGVSTYFKPGASFLFGLQELLYPNNTKERFHYRSIHPTRLSQRKYAPNVPLNFSIYNLNTKVWGTYMGIVAKNNNNLNTRVVITFPGVPKACPKN